MERQELPSKERLPAPAQEGEPASTQETLQPPPTGAGSQYLKTTGVVVLCSLVAWPLSLHANPSDLVMVYLLGVVFVATRYSRTAAILASLLSVATFDYFFVPPIFAFTPSDSAYIPVLAAMLIVGLVISALSERIRHQADLVRLREQRTQALYCLSRDFARMREVNELIKSAVKHIREIFDCRAVVLLPNSSGQLAVPEGSEPAFILSVQQMNVAQQTFESHKVIVPEAKTLMPSACFCLPLVGAESTVGVLVLNPKSIRKLMAAEQRDLLETFVNQTALALERAALSDLAERAQLEVETEKMRNALLSSVSHDLRTPLSAITGAASSLMEDGATMSTDTLKELSQSIYQESARLNRLVRNLLDMTRLESGAIKVKKDWYSLEELIGGALTRLEKRLRSHKVVLDIKSDLPLIKLDDVLIDQVLVNLLDNAVKYSPAESEIQIRAWTENRWLIVEVANTGSSVAPGEEEKIFEKFFRGKVESTAFGAGLGLTICRGIIEAHGGKIWAAHKEEATASFCFTLPIEAEAPTIELEDLEQSVVT